MTIRTYTELCTLATFEERYRYLQLRGSVGHPTFAHERWMNQQFYTSRQWKDVRQEVIARDEGMDLGIPGYEIYDKIIVHHMNPMAPDDIEHSEGHILNPEYLICVTHKTHNAIHYGDESLLAQPLIERRPGDTRLW